MASPRNPVSPEKSSTHVVTRLLTSLYPAEDKRFQNAAYLAGDAYWGQAIPVFDRDGKGSGRIIEQAAFLAAEHETARCQWRFGPRTRALLVTTPSDIQSILNEHKAHLIHHDSTGSFNAVFGPQAIFGYPYGSSEHTRLRARFRGTLFQDSALQRSVKPMHEIIDYYINEISHAPLGIVNLKELTGSITMDMIGKKLGFAQVDNEVKHHAIKIIARIATELAAQGNQISDKYFYNSFNMKWYGFVGKWIRSQLKKAFASNMDILLDAGEAIIKEKIIKPNQENILTTQNWLNPNPAKPIKAADLYTQEAVDAVKQFYIAGSETTATLLQAVLMLLADPNHAMYLQTAQDEVAEQKIAPAAWDKDTLKHAPYLMAILKEALRLYPPIPDLVFQVASEFEFAGGRCNKGDMIIISPRVTHQLQSVWGDNADQFNPDRFLQPLEEKAEHDLKFCYFPFGFMPRECPGQRFALQEAAFIVARLIDEFDFTFDPSCESLAHPFAAQQVFTLRMEAPSVKLHFSARHAKTADCVNPDAGSNYLRPC